MKEMKNRFKELIGESVKDGSSPILSEEFVTNEKLAKTLSEQREVNKKESKLIKESIESKAKKEKEAIEEGWEDENDVISEGEDVIFELTFLNESEDKTK